MELENQDSPKTESSLNRRELLINGAKVGLSSISASAVLASGLPVLAESASNLSNKAEIPSGSVFDDNQVAEVFMYSGDAGECSCCSVNQSICQLADSNNDLDDLPNLLNELT